MSLVAGLLNQSIDMLSSVTTDGWGDITKVSKYSDVPCRWEPVQGTVLTRENEEVIYQVAVWFDNNISDIDYDWIITKSGRDYRILSIQNEYDLGGDLDHILVFLV